MTALRRQNVLGRHDLAVDLAFRTLETEAADDDELHRRFVRLGGAHGHRLSVQALDARQGGLDYAGTSLQWEAPLGDSNRLALTLQQENPSRNDAATLGRDPDNRRLLALQLSHQSARSLWLAGLHQSEGLARNTGLLLAQTYTVDSRLRLDWALNTGALTADSLPLRVAGLDDKLAAGFNWTPDGRHHLNLRLEQHDYLAQTGESLGSGRTLLLEAGHRLFAGQSDQMLKIQLGEGRFSAAATPAVPGAGDTGSGRGGGQQPLLHPAGLSPACPGLGLRADSRGAPRSRLARLRRAGRQLLRQRRRWLPVAAGLARAAAGAGPPAPAMAGRTLRTEPGQQHRRTATGLPYFLLITPIHPRICL
jgi:hypothetical protein